jgi:hypothetical protein
MPASSIDEVLSALTTIIDNSCAHASRVGYFDALYRRVTQSVKEGIAAGRFQNGPLMERLDIVFANRYLDAISQFQAGRQPARSWAVALEATSDRFPLILQQLLAGMNAHTNLDLGIATAQVAPGDQLPESKPISTRLMACWPPSSAPWSRRSARFRRQFIYWRS